MKVALSPNLLVKDIYKEATVRWYDSKSQDKHISIYDIEEER